MNWEKYKSIILESFSGYWNYLINEILHPHLTNYFYWLIGLSLVVWALEIAFPWRDEQRKIRKDFWLDVFYMFFNFFLFSLIIYNAFSNVFVELFRDVLAQIGITNLVAIEVVSWPVWSQLILLFIIRDFIQWNVHRILHNVPWLWEFHKVHHSVEEMGFAAHLRFHWMETIIYRFFEYLPLAMIGFGLKEFFIVHIISLAIGHINHSNLRITYGPLKYILNNPVMHLWHHSYKLPEGKNGVNYGLSLSLWDYLFGTVHMPFEDKNLNLGFPGMNKFPHGLIRQLIYPISKESKEE